VVLDTNVLLAGLATHGLCEALLKLVYRDHEPAGGSPLACGRRQPHAEGQPVSPRF